MTTGQWFYLRNGEQHGPVLPLGLKAMADRGQLQPDGLVREEGSTEWIPATRLSGLFRRPELFSLGATGELTNDALAIPFLPVTPPLPLALADPNSTKRWQFGIQEMMVAMALAAAACWVGGILFRIKGLPTEIENGLLVLIAVLLGGATGFLGGNLKKGLLCGCIVGVAICEFPQLILATIAIGLVWPVVWFVRRPSKSPAIGASREATIVSRRQTIIYRISLVCIATLLLVWLPIVIFERPGRWIRPMGQALVTMACVLPATIGIVCMAIRQFFAAKNKWLGLIALLAALAPIAVYAFTQWLILSVYGMNYED